MHCLVKDGLVIRGPVTLPFEYENMTGFDKVNDPTVFGWLPYEETDEPKFNPNTHKLSVGFKVDGKTVSRTYTIVELSEEEKASGLADAISQVDHERDRRIADGFTFQGKVYQSADFDIQNILGASTAAFMAQVQGRKAGDLRWFDSANDFQWIAMDNSLIPMDAETVVRLGMAAASWKSKHIFAARAIKNRIAGGEDVQFTDDSLWPSK